MKPSLLLATLSALALCATVLATGCASSERMNRLGWDSSSYSAPKASRISGGKYDEAVVSLRTPVGLQDRQVNVWPFCTVNSRYVSILWPFIDWDDFGMAVRPFYNREGNDASILFPLSSWNPQDGEGWALNVYWDPEYYGAFPLFHVGREPDTFWFAGPFVGNGRGFGFVPLCYFGERFRFTGPLWWVKDDLAATMPDDRWLPFSCGFFPLFWKFGDSHALFPLYLKTQDSFYSPLLWMEKDINREGDLVWTDGHYMLLGHWHDDWKHHGFFPFYDIDGNDLATNWIGLWWWKHNKPEHCGLFPFAWFNTNSGEIFPFAKWEKRTATRMDGSEEEWTEGDFLLLGYWNRTAWGFFPFFRGSSADSDMKYIGPLWWAYDEQEREYGFFPFFRVERQEGDTNRSYLFPVYSWEKDRYGSKFKSIPFSRKDYDYPEHRATTAEHGRRYLIYETFEKRGNIFNGERERDDYLSRWDFSPSFLADKKALMKDEDLTEEEAGRKLRDEVVAHTETRTTALHPFFEWTRSDDDSRELSFLLYLLDFERAKDSSSTSLLWHILYSSGSETEKDAFGLETTSDYACALGAFPYWSRETCVQPDKENPSPDGFGNGTYIEMFLSDCIHMLLKRALIEDGSEESREWSRNVLNEFTGKRYLPKEPAASEASATTMSDATANANNSAAPGSSSGSNSFASLEMAGNMKSAAPGAIPTAANKSVPGKEKLRSIIEGLRNEDVIRACGMDRAISGEMTAEEAEKTAKLLMDAVVQNRQRDGKYAETTRVFFPFFAGDWEKMEKDGAETPVSTEFLTPLTYTSNDRDKSSTNVLLGILGDWESRTYVRHLNGHDNTKTSFSTLGLIRTSTKIEPRTRWHGYFDGFDSLVKRIQAPVPGDNPVLAAFRDLLITEECDQLLDDYSISIISPFRDCIKRYRDGKRTEADGQALIAELTKLDNEYFWRYDVEDTSSGFYPFFFWNTVRADRNGEKIGSSNSWFVLPLLSGGSSNPEGSSLGILCPLIYYGATKTPQQFGDPGFGPNFIPSGIDLTLPPPEKIMPADANVLKASHDGDPVRGRTDHYALFLVGSSSEQFAQWKPEANPLVQEIYQELSRLTRDFHQSYSPTAYYCSTLTPAEIAAQAKKAAARDGSISVKDYEKKILSDSFGKGYDLIRKNMEKLGMKPFDPDTPLKDSFEALRREIAEQYIQMCTVTGFNTGWSLLSSSFECEETGDYQTNVLFGLGANSQKLGAKEHRSILGYLYNMDTDGVNTRKFIFPFITTKEAPGFHEWSFLGGLFERSEENGKTGGRIFFFPYGNRPGKK